MRGRGSRSSGERTAALFVQRLLSSAPVKGSAPAPTRCSAPPAQHRPSCLEAAALNEEGVQEEEARQREAVVHDALRRGGAGRGVREAGRGQQVAAHT